MSVTVVGVDGGLLPPGAAEALDAAELVLGAPTQLAAVRPSGPVREVRRLADTLAVLADAPGRTVLLASGDPGFFGIVRALRSRGIRPVVLPAASSVQRAFAAIGRPWDDVAVVSAHGRDLRPALNVCRARPAVAVLTAPGAGPGEIAEGLRGWQRTLLVAENLGGPSERVAELGPGPWREPNLLLCLADPEAVAPRGWIAGDPPAPQGWALPEDAFVHRDSMITKAEVRALALARLGPGLGRLVWDVGAGSGAVAVECARLGAAAVAVERDPQQCARIVGNAGTHGVDVRVVQRSAPEALTDLPEPDAVFVGGGGVDVVRTCAAVASRVVVALAALDRVAPCRAVLTEAGHTVAGLQVAASRLTDLPDGGVRLAATNPVLLLWGQR